METKKFLIEGEKNVAELLESDFDIECVYVTKDFKEKYLLLLKRPNMKVQVVEKEELGSLGTLEQNDGALAIAFQKIKSMPPLSDLTLVLDDIRDPGNLGTLIRIADWYGISDIICSKTCVDWYNPKVINATMGSFTRVSGHSADIAEFLKNQDVPLIGAFLEGKSVHTFPFPEKGILVIGSESHGIGKDIEKLITEKVTIPRHGKAESLNAAVATGIILDRWKNKK